MAQRGQSLPWSSRVLSAPISFWVQGCVIGNGPHNATDRSMKALKADLLFILLLEGRLIGIDASKKTGGYTLGKWLVSTIGKEWTL